MSFFIPLNKVSKLFIGGIILIISFLFVIPQKAMAQWLTFDVPQEISGASSAIADPITATMTTAEKVKEYVIDPLARTVLKTIIKRLTAQTVNWINSGFQGNPAFVTDPDQFFLNVGDTVASDFLSETGLANQLCSPFKAQVRLALVKNYINDDQNYSCTLSKIKDNYEEFTKDFSQGGWEGWFEVTQNDSNNPYGAYLQAQNQLAIEVGNQQEKYRVQLQQGNGFLSFEKCPANSTVTASNVAQYSAEFNRKFKVGDCAGPKETVTPGSVIESQLNKALGTDLTQLELARSVDEIASALLTQLFSRVLGNEGLKQQGDKPLDVPPLPDISKPFITLVGKSPIKTQKGVRFEKPGAFAYDYEEGDISDKVVVSGNVNINTIGTYTVTYNVKNSKGISAVPVILKVEVVNDLGDKDPVVTCTTDENGTLTCTSDSGDGGSGDGGEDDGPKPDPDKESADVGAMCDAVQKAVAESGKSRFTDNDRVNILTKAATEMAGSGWGLFKKGYGYMCGPGLSCDIMYDGKSCYLYDVLTDTGAICPPILDDFKPDRAKHWYSPVGASFPTTACTGSFVEDTGTEPPAPTANPNPTPTTGSPVITSVSPMNVIRGQTTMTITGTNLTDTVQFIGNSGPDTRGKNDGVTTTGTQTKVLIPASLPVGNYNVRVYKNATTYSNEKGPIQVNNSTGTGGAGLPTVTPTSVWSPSQTANGWYPKLSPDGKYVAYGNKPESWVTNLQTKQNWNFSDPPDLTSSDQHQCYGGGWIKSDTLSFSCLSDNDTFSFKGGFYRYEVKVGEWLARRTSDDPRNVAGNFSVVKDGHWVSLTGARIAKDNFVLPNSNGMGSPSISGNTLVTACDNNTNTKICVWNGNTLSKKYAAKPSVLDTDTYNGYIAYSTYSRTIRGITPTGGEVDLTLNAAKTQGFNESGVKLFSVNGTTYVATFAWNNSTNKAYILMRAWGSQTYKAVEALGLLGSIVHVNNNFIIATHSDTGFLRVYTVPSGTTGGTPPTTPPTAGTPIITSLNSSQLKVGEILIITGTNLTGTVVFNYANDTAFKVYSTGTVNTAKTETRITVPSDLQAGNYYIVKVRVTSPTVMTSNGKQLAITAGAN